MHEAPAAEPAKQPADVIEPDDCDGELVAIVGSPDCDGEGDRSNDRSYALKK